MPPRLILHVLLCRALPRLLLLPGALAGVIGREAGIAAYAGGWVVAVLLFVLAEGVGTHRVVVLLGVSGGYLSTLLGNLVPSFPRLANIVVGMAESMLPLDQLGEALHVIDGMAEQLERFRIEIVD